MVNTTFHMLVSMFMLCIDIAQCIILTLMTNSIVQQLTAGTNLDFMKIREISRGVYLKELEYRVATPRTSFPTQETTFDIRILRYSCFRIGRVFSIIGGCCNTTCPVTTANMFTLRARSFFFKLSIRMLNRARLLEYKLAAIMYA